MWLTGSVWKVLEGFAEKFWADLNKWIFFFKSAKLAENAILKKSIFKGVEKWVFRAWGGGGWPDGAGNGSGGR